MGIFYINIKYLPDDINLLLPYILLIYFCTFLIGNKAGLFISILSIVFWFFAKTNLFSSLSLDNYINLLIKSIFVFLQYLFIVYVKKLYNEVKSLSLVDDLTGLYNRRGFNLLAQHETSKINRKKENISLMFIDIDNFKTENDNRGHKEGDKILKELSHVIKNTTRNIDIAARFGGDEFCVLLPDVDKNETDIIANRIIDHFHQSCVRSSWDISISIGIITTDKQFILEELVKRSDELMYKAKKGGKNRIAHDSI